MMFGPLTINSPTSPDGRSLSYGSTTFTSVCIGALPTEPFFRMALSESSKQTNGAVSVNPNPSKNLIPLFWKNSMIVIGQGAPPEIKRSEEHTSELQSRGHLVCRLLLEKKK